MRFIAVDIECDQPSNNIIQLGAAAFDTNQPSLVGTINRYLDQGEVNWSYPLDRGGTLEDLLGQDFKEAYQFWAAPPGASFDRFWDWVDEIKCGKKFVQWGTGDMRLIQRQSGDSRRIEVFNLKDMYKLLYQPANKLPKKYGLEAACVASLGAFNGRPHSAYWDAWNTGKLAVKMFKSFESERKIREIVGG